MSRQTSRHDKRPTRDVMTIVRFFTSQQTLCHDDRLIPDDMTIVHDKLPTRDVTKIVRFKETSTCKLNEVVRTLPAAVPHAYPQRTRLVASHITSHVQFG